MVARPDGPGAGAHAGGPPSTPACVPAAALDGQEVVTAEGLGTPDALHPVQHEMAVRGGSQCGYCTPGVRLQHGGRVLPRRPRRPTARRRDHEHGPNGFDLHALSGNLCRCTGYRPIRDAAYALGRPAADDPLPTRLAARPPPAAATRLEGAAGVFVRAGRPRRGAGAARRAPGRRARRRLDRLGRRGQPPRRAGAPRRRHRPAARAARAPRGATTSSRSARP